MPEDKIKAHIVSYLTGSISEDNLRQLQQWIDASKENRKLFNMLKDAWTVSGRIPVSASALDDSWQGFLGKMHSAGVLETREGKSRSIAGLLRIAASWLVLFALGSGLTWIMMSRQKAIPGKIIEVSAPLGSRSLIKMSDGTRIWINAGTCITYNEAYGQKTRTVNLNGEAYFDVARDKSHPFIVQTTGLLVRALGTKFNVKAYSDEKTISATLEEGKIDVRILRAGDEKGVVLLKPNEKIVYYREINASQTYKENSDEKVISASRLENVQPVIRKDVNVLSHVDTRLYTSWKDARWIIQGEQLGTLAPMLERRYNLQIVFSNEELKKYKFSGTIENETVDQILDALRMTAPIDYAINKDVITFSLNPNDKEEYGRIITRKN